MLSMEIIKTTIFFLILLYASVKDIKIREVPDNIPIMICITALINNSVNNILYMTIGAILISIPQVVIAAKNPGTYGGADIKIVAACTFYLGLMGGLIIITMGLLLLVCFNITKKSVQKRKGYPLIPFYALFCILKYILSFENQ